VLKKSVKGRLVVEIIATKLLTLILKNAKNIAKKLIKNG